MTHYQIRKFSIDGYISDDRDIPRLKEEYFRLLLQQMGDLGYVHLLDIDPLFSLDYETKHRRYRFVYTLYGVYYGIEKAGSIDGISDGRELFTSPSARRTPRDRSDGGGGDS